jgi:hypothetical protein
MTDKRNRRGGDDDHVSLAPLDPEQALRALLKVDPESEPVEDGPTQDADADDSRGDRPQ